MAVRSTKEIESICKQYYTNLLKLGIPVEKVILFGSYARSKQNRDSDIDLAVILKYYRKDRFETRLELLKAAREFNEIIEPYPFLISDFNESDPFASEIIRSGEEIYS